MCNDKKARSLFGVELIIPLSAGNVETMLAGNFINGGCLAKG